MRWGDFESCVWLGFSVPPSSQARHSVEFKAVKSRCIQRALETTDPEQLTCTEQFYAAMRRIEFMRSLDDRGDDATVEMKERRKALGLAASNAAIPRCGGALDQTLHW